MKFNYETQGAITYLVCELEPTEQLDSLTLGMLTNNHIVGLAPVLYTEMNSQRFLKYNISAKLSADQFFGGNLNKQRTLQAFQNILNGVCSADEYMIEPNCFLMDSEHIFLNVSSCETALICVPVVSDKNINVEVANTFKKILFSTQFDSSEDASYITQLITYINDGVNFSIYGLKDLVERLSQQPERYISPVMPQSNMAVKQASVDVPVQKQVAQQPIQPMPSFDSTISIDDMPEIMKHSGTMQSMSPISSAPPVQSAMPQTPPAMPSGQPVQSKLVTPPVQQKPVIPPVQPVQSKPMIPPVQPVQPKATVQPVQPIVNIPKSQPVSNLGFAIPGQNNSVGNKVQEKSKGQQVKAEPGEKQITLFGLLAHYNKENATLYKAQKAAKKTKSVPAQPPITPKPQQVPVTNVNPTPAMVQTPPVYTPPQQVVQPVPVQNSFNETTVLSSFGGETTVLSMNPGVVEPCLTRVKTGERIQINKPVFRIGKEKSYVDYFIGDNTAISRSHANIHTENGEYFVEDTNSTNHTYINGKLINSNVKTKIMSGDKVRLANEDFIFTL